MTRTEIATTTSPRIASSRYVLSRGRPRRRSALALTTLHSRRQVTSVCCLTNYWAAGHDGESLFFAAGLSSSGPTMRALTFLLMTTFAVSGLLGCRSKGAPAVGADAGVTSPEAPSAPVMRDAVRAAAAGEDAGAREAGAE